MTQKKFKYIISGEYSTESSIVIKTIGTENIGYNYNKYPPEEGHPEEFLFNPSKGRTLNIYILLYIAKGKGLYFYSKDNFIDIKEGDIILITPNTLHSYKPNKNTGWEEYWIGFDVNRMEEYMENLFAQNINIYNIGIHDKILNLFKDAIKVANEEKPGFQQYLSGITNLILSMTNYYEKNKSTDPATEDIINKSKIIIKENLLNGITPEQVANEVNLSYSWFRKIFKDYTGVTPSQYIQEIKIQKAREMLTSSHMQVKEIVYKLGYDDVAYFIKIFKKYTNQSPSEYRKLFYE